MYVWPHVVLIATHVREINYSFPKLSSALSAGCCPCGLLISPAGKCYAWCCGSTYAAAARKLHAIASFMIYSIGRYTINYMHLWINVWFDFNFSCSVRSWKCYDVDLSTFVACVLAQPCLKHYVCFTTLMLPYGPACTVFVLLQISAQESRRKRKEYLDSLERK